MALNPRYAGGDIKWDPRFGSLLRATLPQTQGWWTSASPGRQSIRKAIMAFIGIPDQGTRLDQGRYLTVTGCVPQVCGVKGMLWIDTGVTPAVVIFVAEQLALGQKPAESGYHLLIYTSRSMSTYVDANSGGTVLFPPDFLLNLTRWHKASMTREDEQHILLVTVFGPDEHSHDYFLDSLFHQLKYVEPQQDAKGTR